MVGNKKVMCNICYREMRSDVLKRHMKQHADLSSEDPEQICKSILEDVINDISETSIYRRKVNDLNSDGMDELHNPPSIYRKKTKVNDLHSDGMDELHKPLSVGVDEVKLRNTIRNNNHHTITT